MTSIAHERFHAVAEEPAYTRENAPAVRPQCARGDQPDRT